MKRQMIAGDRVTHPQYGEGTLVEASSAGLTVDLDSGERLFANRYGITNWTSGLAVSEGLPKCACGRPWHTPDQDHVRPLPADPSQ